MLIRPNDTVPWFRVRVVGVVENVNRQAGEAKPPPQMCWTVDRARGKSHYLVVRSSRPAGQLAPGLRRAVAELDPDLPLSRIRTLKALVRDATQGDRLVSLVMDYCMVLAIALVVIYVIRANRTTRSIAGGAGASPPADAVRRPMEALPGRCCPADGHPAHSVSRPPPRLWMPKAERMPAEVTNFPPPRSLRDGQNSGQLG
jgi:hypothetical protein